MGKIQGPPPCYPASGLDVGQICAYFHQGLSLNNKQYIQMMFAGEFYEKSAREAIQFFDTIAENTRTWETNKWQLINLILKDGIY